MRGNPQHPVAQGIGQAGPVCREPGREAHRHAARAAGAQRADPPAAIGVEFDPVITRSKCKARPFGGNALDRSNRLDRAGGKPGPFGRGGQHFLADLLQRHGAGEILAQVQAHAQQRGQLGIVGRNGNAQPVLELGQRGRRQHGGGNDGPLHGGLRVWGWERVRPRRRGGGRRGRGVRRPGGHRWRADSRRIRPRQAQVEIFSSLIASLSSTCPPTRLVA